MKTEPINTVSSKEAVNKIKAATKKQIIGFSDKVPKQLAEKKQYMQSESFWNDPHNAKMWEYTDELIRQRDAIAKEIEKRNKIFKDNVIVQGINGYARIKKFLDSNPRLNFAEFPSMELPAENKYSIIRKFKIGNLAREARRDLGIL